METTMHRIFALLGCGMALMATSPVLAQEDDDDVPALPDTPADVFSGPHIEASIGGYYVKNTSYNNLNLASDFSANKKALTYGGALGYDIPLTENWTIGVETGFYTSKRTWTNPNLVAGTFNTSAISPGRDLFFGARIGNAISMKTQIFGKLGLTNSQFGIYGTNGNGTLYDAINATGLRIGGGIEHHMTRSIYIKLEYDYSKYGTGQFNYHGTTPDASSFDVHANRHQGLGSIGFRF